MTVCPVKTQISLCIRPVWSVFAVRSMGRWGPKLSYADSEDSDQTGRMPRLIWVFAGHTCHFVGFVMRQLILWATLKENLTVEVYEQERLNHACSANQASKSLGILNIKPAGIMQPKHQKTKALISLHGCEANVCLCCSHYGINRFYHDVTCLNRCLVSCHNKKAKFFFLLTNWFLVKKINSLFCPICCKNNIEVGEVILKQCKLE